MGKWRNGSQYLIIFWASDHLSFIQDKTVPVILNDKKFGTETRNVATAIFFLTM